MLIFPLVNQLELKVLDTENNAAVLNIQVANLKQEISSYSTSTKQSLGILTNQAEQEQISEANLQNEEASDTYLANQDKLFISYSYKLIYWGSAFTLIGFSLWYFKLQRYQDKIIKRKQIKVDITTLSLKSEFQLGQTRPAKIPFCGYFLIFGFVIV